MVKEMATQDLRTPDPLLIATGSLIECLHCLRSNQNHARKSVSSD